MKLNEYQNQAVSTAIYPHDGDIPYLALALCGEAGEMADKVKKVVRDKSGKYDDSDCAAIALEIGDVLWYAANLAKSLGYDLSSVPEMNRYYIVAFGSVSNVYTLNTVFSCCTRSDG